ncbi:MAG TPA: FtsK/SpoIIIE domain-containing protein [Acidimicrobiales bacterium]|nr:FtsK/SpoIIIE domain-containing protein [Acidimicrobiales bacterium]
MQLVYEDGDGRRELDLRVNRPSATVGDLAVALRPAGGRLSIGDRRPDLDVELAEAGLYEGAAVRFDGPADRPGPSRGRRVRVAARELVVVNGLDAGRRFPLAPGGRAVLGRDPRCDIVLHDETVSRRHAAISAGPDGTLLVSDLRSRNGTWVGDTAVGKAKVAVAEGLTMRLGTVELEARAVNDRDRPVAVDPLRHATAAGTIPFNRPPRPAPPPALQPIEVPEPPRQESTNRPLSVIGMAGPLVLALGMFAVLKSPFYLMFAALSPVMAISQWLSGRREGRTSRRRERQRYRKDLERFVGRLAALSEDEHGRRREAFPDPAEILRRVTLPSRCLWERRPGHADFLRLRAGVGDVPWEPPVAHRPGGPGHQTTEELSEAIRDASILRHSAVPVDLSGGGVVGVVGNRPAALAFARSLLCQAVVLHGPADLPVMVLVRPETAPAWDWAKWLPHTREPSGRGRMLSADAEGSTRLVEAVLKAGKAKDPDRPASSRPGDPPAGATRLVVVDDHSLLEGRRAPARKLLRGDGGPVAGIVVAGTIDRLPAMCDTVVEVHDADGQAELFLPQQGWRVDHFMACGLSDDTARACARSLARYEDPELEILGAGLPASVRLLPLLELEECSAEAVSTRWKACGPDPRPVAPIGVTEDDVFRVDFVADGPHALVGGTTGAGKSELLRTMVAGLAANVDPDHLTFVLVDFKGGSAFDECAKLPHTVGMVTDLDEHLAERALRCLEAELRHRERVLRRAGATDLPDYLRKHPDREPMPRLLVIVDEFATLKAELPDFIDALVGVAQRGRSLGVHMLLATQRPQGAINDNIRANTNLRIALRTQDSSDSSDILGTGEAAEIPRTSPGRAYVRLGPDEVVAIQSALATGSRTGAAAAALDLAPFVFGPLPRLPAPPAPPTPMAVDEDDAAPVSDETDLALLVSAITAAFDRTGRPPPRRPWPEPLPAELDLDALVDQARAARGSDGPLPYVPVALGDDPDAQTQYPVGWHPGDGNLLVYGVAGSGTTTTLASLALALARIRTVQHLHLYVMDFGAGELAPLGRLPHCGGYVQPNERERQQRLIRVLRDELDRRRQLRPADRAWRPHVLTLIDGWTAFVDDHQDLAGQDLVDSLIRICTDGPEVGLYTVIAADRPSGVSQKLVATIRQRWALKLADPHDYALVNVGSRAVPKMLPGHALMSESHRLAHVARPRQGLAAAVERIRSASPPAPPECAPHPIRSLPPQVPWHRLGATAQLTRRPWVVPVGMAETDLRPVALTAYEGEHALVAGPARSGKSSTLLTVADAVLAARPDAHVAAVAGARSPLASDPRIRRVVDPDDVRQLQHVLETDAPLVLVLVDDAETIDEPLLDPLGTSRRPNLLVIAAGRSDLLRSAYQHWTRPLRRSKLGVLLQPDVDLDGELFGCRLPRHPPVAMTVGRGYVVTAADPVLAQIALPDRASLTSPGRHT